jgi:aspartate/methionine/tyrosine aminotransferase
MQLLKTKCRYVIRTFETSRGIALRPRQSNRACKFLQLVAGISPFGFQIANPVIGPTETELDMAYGESCAVSLSVHSSAASLICRFSLDMIFPQSGLNPKFVLITNPHNPLGIIYKPEVVATIVTWARKRKLHTIVDEVYALSTHQKHGHGFRSVIQILDNQLEDNVHWLWSMSKDFGASGLRVGYVYSQNETFLKGFADLNGFSGVAQPMQLLVSNLLSDDTFVDSYLDQSRERVLRNYKACTQTLDDMGLSYVPAEAGLFLYVDFSSLLPEKTVKFETSLSNLMIEHARVLLTPGQSQKDWRPGMFRICYAWVTPEELQIAMARLGRLVEKLRRLDWADLDAESIDGVI